MELTLTSRTASGVVSAPVSKSEAHRALIGAALSALYRGVDDGRSIRVGCRGSNADTDATARCLRALGVTIIADADGYLVTPLNVRDLPRRAVLDCGASGSTLRFLLPVVCALCGLPGAPEGMEITFTGTDRLPLRPLSPLDALMTAHGARIEPHELGRSLPLTVGGRLMSGDYTLDGSISSQYVSGLLFALPLLGGASTLTVTGRPASAPYIGLTLDTLRRVGCAVEGGLPRFTIPGRADRAASGAAPCPGVLPVGGDWSAGAVLLALGLLSGGGAGVTVTGLDPQSAQGDRAILHLLRAMGGEIDESTAPDGAPAFTARPSRLHGVTMDASDVPDLVPVIAACAAVSDGETIITGAARLRDKESDRLASLGGVLNALGGRVTVTPDGLRILGVPALDGGTVDAHGDHRVVFAAALASLRCRRPVTITGAEAAAKSYPAFADELRRLTSDRQEN